MNDAEFLLSQLETVRGYGQYVPDENMMGEPESERFQSACDGVKRALQRMDPEDLEEFQDNLWSDE